MGHTGATADFKLARYTGRSTGKRPPGPARQSRNRKRQKQEVLAPGLGGARETGEEEEEEEERGDEV